MKPIGVRSDPGSPVYAGHQPRQGLTYQSLLQDGGQPANGVFDLSFALFASETGGTASATIQINDLAETNGVYTAVCNPRGTTQARMAGCWPKVILCCQEITSLAEIDAKLAERKGRSISVFESPTGERPQRG